MDAKDLFEIIGRLYAANAELTKEGEAMKSHVNALCKKVDVLKADNEEWKKKYDELAQKKAICEVEKERLEKEIAELKNVNAEYLEASDDLKCYIKRLEAEAKIVDARREEETLKEDEF